MKSVPDRVEALFEEQIRHWPLLAQGIEGLSRAQTRRIRVGWYDIFARHIPHRLGSSTAKVDKASIEKRPCFLCRGNLPPEQKGIELDAEFTLYCNPFPILERHLTIIHRDHRPQLLASHVEAMLSLASDLPGFFVIYNGPECGASAPDHLHFQACSRRFLPIERDTAGIPGPGVDNYGRRVLLFRESQRDRLVSLMTSVLDALGQVTGKKPEPMLNVATFREKDEWTVFLFPRGKHRPDVFHSGELTVSPGAIDLCGVFVLPYEPDFQRIGAEDIKAVLEEVTLPANEFDAVLSALRRKP
jgi:hypothetical protein